MAENHIKHLRTARGWSQEELAQRAGTSNQQISLLENSERRLTVDWMNRISDALGCSPADLMTEGGAAHTPRKRALLKIFDQMSDEDQDRLIKLGLALAEPPEAVDADDQETGAG